MMTNSLNRRYPRQWVQATTLPYCMDKREMPTNILMVEDHRLVADAMKYMLTQIDPAINVSACYSTQQALSMIDSGKHFELILTDLMMPDIDGISLLVGLKNRDIQIPVVVVSGCEDDTLIRTSISHGACGFIPKTLPATEMISGLQQVLAGGRYFPNRLAALAQQSIEGDAKPAVGHNSNAARPGHKQLQVLQLIAAGHSNKQISQIVGITEATVKYHSSQLFKLLGVKNRTSCVREAQQRGLLNSFDENSEPVA